MTRITTFAKVLIFSIFLSMVNMIRPAQAQDAGIVVAAITLLQTILMNYLQGILTVDLNLVGAGIRAQVAADTVGVQNALQHHAGATINALAQATAIDLDWRNMIEWGDMGSIRTPNGVVRLNAVAPSGCRRTRDAQVLSNAVPLRLQRTQQWRTRSTARTSAVRNTGQSQMRLAQAATETPERFSMQWLTSETLTPQQTADAEASITNLINPLPMPTLAAETSPAAKEYAATRTVLDQRTKVVEEALRRQLDLRAPLSNGSDAGSTLSAMTVLNGWSRDTVESTVYPDRVQAKGSPASAREQVFLLSANLYVNTELLRSLNDLTAIMAVQTATELSGVTRDTATDLYERAITGQDQD